MYKNNKFLDCLLIRKEDSNKGTYGKTIIIGGSINYPGSIVIASSAALKCGVGYVCLGVTKSVYNRVACVNPEVIYEVFEDDNFYDEKVLTKCLKYSSILFGNGIVDSKKEEALDFLLSNYKGKLIIDAGGLDALKNIGLNKLKESSAKIVLTPHLKEFERLLNIASNASPMFLIGSIGATMLGDIKLGFILLIGNYLAPMIVGILTIKQSKNLSNMKEVPANTSNINFGTALKSALDNGVNTTLQVRSFVVLFSIIISIIKNNAYISIIFSNIENFLNLPQYSLYGIFLGSVEFTNGCKLITTLPLTIPFKLSIISFICSFSGFSVIAQISSFVSKYNVSLAKYSFYKLIQGIISFFITFVISSVFTLKYTAYTSTFIPDNYNITIIIYLFILLSLICTLIIAISKKLHRS